MDLMTVQVGRWRLCQKHKAEFIDITVKSGLKIFAPTWEMVLGHKTVRSLTKNTPNAIER